MPLRDLRESSGLAWRVWDVHPTWALPRLPDVDPSSPDGASRRPLLSPGLAGGWLTFESALGERRRIVPIPAGWDALDEAALADLLARATPVRPRIGGGLIE